MKRSLLLTATALLGMALSANAEMKDITPEGYDFSTYENKAVFPLLGGNDYSDATATVNASPWTYRDRHNDAFTKNKQLTTLVQRSTEKSTDTWATYYNSYFTVTELYNYKTKYSYGKCLVVNMPYAILGSASIVPPAKINGSYVSFHSNYIQLNFYLDPTKIENFTTTHYVRVRIVYNVLNKGREYIKSNPDNVRNMDMWATWIWGTADDGTIIPEGDADSAYPNSDDENGRKKDNAKWGDDFALWKGMEFDAYSGVEGAVYDVNKIADEHEIYYAEGLEQSQLDCYDMWIGASTENIDKPHYIMNCDRWMVYEFDMPVDPAHGTAMATMNMRANCNTNYMINEIKFYDLGTDASEATYLGKRNISYKYLAAGAINEYAAAGQLGSGTQDDPYQITCADDIENMKDQVSTTSATYFKLMNDVDMTGVNHAPTVGRFATDYGKTIHFDGNNHVISNLTCTDEQYSYASLFGVFQGSVCNLGLENVNLDGKMGVGGIGGYCGYGSVETTIDNCYVTGKMSNSTAYCGGFAGTNAANLTISNSYAQVEVNGGTYAGGLVGRGRNNITVSNSYASGTVSGKTAAGLLAATDKTSGVTLKVSNFVAFNTGATASNYGSLLTGEVTIPTSTEEGIAAVQGWDAFNAKKLHNSLPALNWEDAEVSGVNDIIEVGNDVPAIYYNFQGIEVKNPANGLYIVKRGNKVTKEYIR